VPSLCLPIKGALLIAISLRDSGFVNPMELRFGNAAKEWTRLYASGA